MPLEKLVVDANAFIKGYPLEELCPKIYTIPEVIKEIRDSATRRRLEVVPYELILEEPSVENVKRATEFSKKTGDYASLSLVDIKLIALAIEIHEADCSPVEFKKTDSTVEEESNSKDKDEGECDENAIPDVIEENLDSSSDDKIKENGQSKEEEKATETCDKIEEEEDDNVDGDDSGGSEESTEEEEEEEEDDGGGKWITPSNYKPKVQSPPNPENSVGILSTDFAIQNVILNTNISLISPYGQRITTLRTYILRCYACFEKTTQFERKFCPRCGNKTLKKITVSVNQKGQMKLHFSKKFVISSRGKKFSLPAPQGGKFAVNPILTEDQHVTQIKRSKKAVAREIGPFAMNDVNTRSFMVQGQSSHYWDARNPNEVKRGKGSKRRN